MPTRDEILEALSVPGEALNELGFRLRYGLSPVEFQQLKVSGAVPGSVANPGPERDPEEQRRAAAYYFARQWPTLAPAAQEAVNALKGMPGLFGSFGPPNPFADDEASEELARIALEASRRGVEDELAEQARRPRRRGTLGDLALLALAPRGNVD